MGVVDGTDVSSRDIPFEVGDDATEIVAQPLFRHDLPPIPAQYQDELLETQPTHVIMSPRSSCDQSSVRSISLTSPTTNGNHRPVPDLAVQDPSLDCVGGRPRPQSVHRSRTPRKGNQDDRFTTEVDLPIFVCFHEQSFIRYSSRTILRQESDRSQNRQPSADAAGTPRSVLRSSSRSACPSTIKQTTQRLDRGNTYVPPLEAVKSLMSFGSDLSHSPTLAEAGIHVLRNGPRARQPENDVTEPNIDTVPPQNPDSHHSLYDYDTILLYSIAIFREKTRGNGVCLYPIFTGAEDESGSLVLIASHLRQHGQSTSQTRLGKSPSCVLVLEPTTDNLSWSFTPVTLDRLPHVHRQASHIGVGPSTFRRVKLHSKEPLVLSVCD